MLALTSSIVLLENFSNFLLTFERKKTRTSTVFSYLKMLKSHHRQPKLALRAAQRLDCFFHAMHNNDIDNI